MSRYKDNRLPPGTTQRQAECDHCHATTFHTFKIDGDKVTDRCANPNCFHERTFPRYPARVSA